MKLFKIRREKLKISKMRGKETRFAYASGEEKGSIKTRDLGMGELISGEAVSDFISCLLVIDNSGEQELQVENT